MRVSFVVYGRAAPAGSKRAYQNKTTGRVHVTDANPQAKPWQQEVRAAALEAIRGPLDGPATAPPWTLLSGPLSLALAFYTRRPKTHTKTAKKGELTALGKRTPTASTTPIVPCLSSRITRTRVRASPGFSLRLPVEADGGKNQKEGEKQRKWRAHRSRD